METPRERQRRIAKKLEHIQKDSSILKCVQEKHPENSSRNFHKSR